MSVLQRHTVLRQNPLFLSINLFDQANYQKDRWQYWLARAELQSPTLTEQANARLSTLAKQRSYHGFLAADRLGIEYGFAEQAVPEESNNNIHPALLRAKELFHIQQDTLARREWLSALKQLEPTEQLQAAKLVTEQGYSYDKAANREETMKVIYVR